MNISIQLNIINWLYRLGYSLKKYRIIAYLRSKIWSKNKNVKIDKSRLLDFK